MEFHELKRIYNTGGKTREDALAAYREIISEKGIDQCGRELLFLAADYAHAEALALLLEAGAPASAVDDYGFTPLHYLARQQESRYHLKPKGEVAACTELLLDHKVSYLRKDENEKMTCYHYAARNGLAGMVETLAKRGAKLDLTDKDGNTGIHIACDYVKDALDDIQYKKKDAENAKTKYEETVKRLKARNMTDGEIAEYMRNNTQDSPETAEAKYQAALDLAEGYFRVVKAFVEGGVDKDEKNSYDQAALDMAVKKGAKKIAAYLSGTLAEEAGEAAAGGMTLHQAAEKGDAEAINAIAKTGADLNALEDGDESRSGGCSALAIACAYLQPQAVEALLSNGADPSFKDGNGRTAASFLVSGLKASLHSGVFNEKRIPRIIRDMVSAGMGIDETVNDDGDTLLILACKADRGTGYNRRSVKGDVIDTALALNPDVKAANRFGETALMHACARDFDMMENIQITLLEQGADPAAADRNGDTALHYAARNGDKNGAKALCAMLLDFGADPAAVNNAGQTALDIATETGNEPLVKLLLAKM
ncbi:MAG: ankyrin repeat domain-containing protein [Treponema sp.]|nr:ankyrin repeat domain-containing protein [Treponema sp.]